MEVRVLHLGDNHWLVREEGQPNGPVYRFNAVAPYRALGQAARRDYIAFGDLIAVDEADLTLLREEA